MKKKQLISLLFCLLIMLSSHVAAVWAGDSEPQTMTLKESSQWKFTGDSVSILSGEGSVISLEDKKITAIAEGEAVVQVDDVIWNITVSTDWKAADKETYHWMILTGSDDEVHYPKLVISCDTYTPVAGETTVGSGDFAYDAYFLTREDVPWGTAFTGSTETDDIGVRSAVILAGADNKKVKPASAYRWFDCAGAKGDKQSANVLTSIDTSGLDTSGVTTTGAMFQRCEKLTTLDVSSFDTSNVTNMAYMFNYCSELTALDVSKFDTSNVTTMGTMFQGCEKLTTLDVSSFKTSNVTDMAFMFSRCMELTALDVSQFDTSNVTTMRAMFQGCEKLTTLDVSKFDTSNVTDMAYMFNYCSELTALDVCRFNTSNVTDMALMFSRCSELTALDVSNFSTSNATNMRAMFYRCEKLIKLDVSRFNTSNVTDMAYMFHALGLKASGEVKITGLSSFYTGNVTTMHCMFDNGESGTGSGKLTDETLAGISGWDVSKVQDFTCMFYGQGTNLTSLDLSKWDTSSVISFCHMFCDCKKLQRLDLSDWKVQNVTTMHNMFDDCYALTTIGDISDWNTAALIDPCGFLNGCTSFVGENGVLDLSGWDTSKVVSFEEMFRSIKVSEIDLSGWTTECLGNPWTAESPLSDDIYYIHAYMSPEEGETDVMFKNCASLTTVYVNTAADYQTKVEISSADMFLNCTQLVGGKGTTFDTTKTDKTYAKIDGGENDKGYFSVKPGRTVNMNSSHGTVTATYGTEGTVIIGGETLIPAGETVTLTIEPSSGCSLRRLTATAANGRSVPLTEESDNTYHFAMPARAVTIYAAYNSPDTDDPAYRLTVEPSEHGTVTASTQNAYAASVVTLTVKADQGWTLKTLSVLDANGKEIEVKSAGSGNNYTFPMPAAPVTVKATFAETEHTSSGGGGGGASTTTGDNPEENPSVSEQPVQPVQGDSDQDQPAQKVFADVSEQDDCYDAVTWGTQNGIVTGVDDSHFAPEAITTRAQLVTLLWRAAGSPKPSAAVCPFIDVRTDAYYHDAVAWAAEKGITIGVDSSHFAPDITLTRAHVVTFLWRYAGSPVVTAENTFTDVADDAYYRNAVLWAKETHITNGTSDTTFSPEKSCTRGQVVTFLYRESNRA